MNILQKATLNLATASNGNPVISTLTVMLFYLMFTLFEAAMERLVFGERFEHLFDLLFAGAFIAYSAYSVYWCAIYNSSNQTSSHKP